MCGTSVVVGSFFLHSWCAKEMGINLFWALVACTSLVRVILVWNIPVERHS